MANGRTLQATHDLRCVARSAGPETLFKLAEGANNATKHDDLARLIQKDGCRVGDPATEALLPSLTLAATLPDDDFEAFTVATSVLLADRLQHGLGTDDMFWHWDAFQEHYLSAAPHVRAALLQGYWHAHDQGLVELMDPPGTDARATDTPATIEKYLAAACEGPLAPQADVIARALSARTLPDRTWEDAGLPLLVGDPAPEAILRCLRHLYETRSDLDIHPGETFDSADDLPLLIPYLPRPADLP